MNYPLVLLYEKKNNYYMKKIITNDQENHWNMT